MTEMEMTKGKNFFHEVTPFPALHSNSDESARCPHGSMEEGNTLPRVLNLIPYSFAPFASCTQNLSNYHQVNQSFPEELFKCLSLY